MSAEFVGSRGDAAVVKRLASRHNVLRRAMHAGILAAAVTLSACGGGGGSSEGAKVGEENDDLQVSPASGFSSSGQTGGTVSPSSMDYVLTNSSVDPVDWSASATQPWILLSSTSGNLASLGQATLTVAIDGAAAAALAEGTYFGAVDISDDTNGTVATRSVTLTIQSDALLVNPASDFVTSGPAGGPFSPTSTDYELMNLGGNALSWSASADQPWITVSAASGSLAVGAQSTLTVSVNAGATGSLAPGSYNGVVTVSDDTNGTLVERDVVLTILQNAMPGSMAAITQFGITWTFDQPYPAGQFANGDWWVVGPISIVSINPPSTTSNGRTINGSQINPDPNSQPQGYDSSMYAEYRWPGSYDPLLNVADGVSPTSPLIVPPNSSLISSISIPAPDQRPQLSDAAVLTVLNTAPPQGSFRPPYTGTDKTVRYNTAQLNWSLLDQLPAVGSMPERVQVENWFRRPWIDHIPDWIGRYAHPTNNMPAFGRDMSDAVGNAALMLHTDLTNAQKDTLLIRFVQLGIDFYGIVEAGGLNNWPAGGGHHSGRKWPILFAGLMLGDAGMSGIGDDEIAFNEDDQTFYVEETAPGVYNYGQGGYTAQDVGIADWGTQHWKQIKRGELPTKDDKDWFGNPYRLCCTANSWWGSVLSAYIMGAKGLWNHDALFDYMDRYLIENQNRGITNWQLSWSDFPIDMWQTYRSNY